MCGVSDTMDLLAGRLPAQLLLDGMGEGNEARAKARDLLGSLGDAWNVHNRHSALADSVGSADSANT